jgi:hypothetical protein
MNYIKHLLVVIMIVLVYLLPITGAISGEEEDFYEVVSDNGKRSVRIVGEGASAAFADSVVSYYASNGSWWGGKSTITVNGIPYTTAEFTEVFEFHLSDFKAVTQREQVDQPIDEVSLKAALTSFFGDEGNAIVMACADNYIQWEFIESEVFTFNPYIKEENGVRTFVVEKDGWDEFRAALAVVQAFKGHFGRFNSYDEYSESDKKLIKDYLRHVDPVAAGENPDAQLAQYQLGKFVGLINFFNEHGGVIAGVVMTLPAMAGGIGADAVIVLGSVYNSIYENEDPTWSAIGLVPYMKLPLNAATKISLKITGGIGTRAVTFSAGAVAIFRQTLTEITEKTIAAGESVILKRLERVAQQRAELGAEMVELGCSAIFCFAGDTLVKTERGKIPIRNVSIGDWVWSWSEVDGAFGYHQVVGTSENIAGEIVEIAVGDDVVRATPNHPVWVKSVGWLPCGELQTGDEIEALGGAARVDSVRYASVPGGVKVYNLTVEYAHTYYVGDLELLCHNASCWRTFVDSRHGGNLISALSDPQLTSHIVNGLFRSSNKAWINLQGRALAVAIRALKPGHHEWIPVNRIYNALFNKVTDGAHALKIIRFINSARIPVDKLWFNKFVDPKTGKNGFSSSKGGRPYGHVGGSNQHGRYTKRDGSEYAFHKACDKAFDDAIASGTFDIDIWKTEMDNKVLKIFFEGEVYTEVKGLFDTAAATWVP